MTNGPREISVFHGNVNLKDYRTAQTASLKMQHVMYEHQLSKGLAKQFWQLHNIY